MASLSQTVGFIGAGQMARALAAGFVRAGLLPGEQILAYDPAPAASDEFLAAAPQSRRAAATAEVVAASDVLVLAVKPQNMAGVLAELRPHVGPRHLVVSIAAGITLTKLAEGLADGGRLVRVMPNTPCLVGQSASGYCLGRDATEDDAAVIQRLLSSVGRAYRFPERLLDAVTGLSGSGPAYVYLMIEALSDGGVSVGLPRDAATVLAAQTVLGAALMVLETGEHPSVLRDRVTSPGGTTIAGLKALEDAGVRAAFIRAVDAATRRSAELGQ